VLYDVKVHLRYKRMGGRTSDGRIKSVRPSYGERTAMLHKNLRGGTNLGPTNKYTKFGQLFIGKIIKMIVTRCHIWG